MSSLLLASAIAYRNAGRSVIPTIGKKPSVAWKRYQHHRASLHIVQDWFLDPQPQGLGIVAGMVSGAVINLEGTKAGVEFLDIDDPASVATFEDLVEAREYGPLLRSLPCEDTPKGGRHYGYLCTAIAGNAKLAQRKIGVQQNGQDDVITLIESRGEGGYCVVAPTPPGVHPDHPERGYVMVRGSWTVIPWITPEARGALWECALALNEYVRPEPFSPTGSPSYWSSSSTITSSSANDHTAHHPGADFNDRVSHTAILALLEQYGWTRIYSRGGADYLRRPGKEERAWSATLGYVAPKVLYVFSSNAYPFEPQHAYDPFGVYARLEHRGDFTAAARALATEGYGDHHTTGERDRHAASYRGYRGYQGYRGYRGLRRG